MRASPDRMSIPEDAETYNRKHNPEDHENQLAEEAKGMGVKKTVDDSVRAFFTDFKGQHRELLEAKKKAQKRLEALRREYDFTANLDHYDNSYVQERKKESMVIMVQRCWRRYKCRKEFKLK